MTDTLHLVAADKVILGVESNISKKLKPQQPNLFARRTSPAANIVISREQLGTDRTFTGEAGGFSPYCFSPGVMIHSMLLYPLLEKGKALL